MQEVIEAYNAIADAELKYRELVRAALQSGVRQVEISKALDRTREMIRRDAMTEDQREELRRADLERKRGKKPGNA